MKKLTHLTLVILVLGLVILGCEKQDSPGIFGVGVLSTIPDGIYGNPTVVTLLAGQNIDVGTVTVANDGVNLYIEYETKNSWCMTETHLHVAEDWPEIPQTKKGNPIPGQFDYNMDHDPAVIEYTYTIPLVLYSGTPLYIAAHAAMQKTIEEAPYYASEVVDAQQGNRKDGTPVRTERSTPEQGLEYETGQSESNFFSLGFGGCIIVEFDCPIRNGDGDDVKIIEDTWGVYPLEEADVYASQDGVVWTCLGTADNLTRDSLGIHSIATFDLGDLNLAMYIKIVDITNPYPHLNTADGYDVNAVTALQDCDCIQEETAWGDGTSFPGPSWGMYFTYEVQGFESGD